MQYLFKIIVIFSSCFSVPLRSNSFINIIKNSPILGLLFTMVPKVGLAPFLQDLFIAILLTVIYPSLDKHYTSGIAFVGFSYKRRTVPFA